MPLVTEDPPFTLPISEEWPLRGSSPCSIVARATGPSRLAGIEHGSHASRCMLYIDIAWHGPSLRSP
eukprot:4240771-Alexandrium_andersonii.AAC.1